MSILCLPPTSRPQLANQVTQNGIFSHTLRDALAGSIRATATIVVEQGTHDVLVRIELGESVNSITLAKREDTGERVACFLEELVNAGHPAQEIDEHLTITILEPDTKRLFKQSIAGYRSANADIDSAIADENWAAINRAQGRRDLHASTIALIANMYAADSEEEVRP